MDDRCASANRCCPCSWPTWKTTITTCGRCCRPASPLTGGETATVNGRACQRIWTADADRRARRGGQANTRVRDLGNGEDITMLRRRCAELAKQHPGFRAASFTPHDFRRLLTIDLINNGLPIHIGAALLGHLNLQTTRGYVAAFNEDVVRHYEEFLDRRRQARSADVFAFAPCSP